MSSFIFCRISPLLRLARCSTNVLLVTLMALSFASCGSGSGNAGNQNSQRQMGGAIQGVALNLNGMVSTLAGAAPGADGIGLAAHFVDPRGVTVLGDFLYVTDPYTIRRISLLFGEVVTVAGHPNEPGSQDGSGAEARFNGLTAITTDGVHLYVTDNFNNTIRKIDPITGAVSTLAGQVQSQGHVDGFAAGARFSDLTAITSDGTSLFVSDDQTVRQVVIASAEVVTLAGLYQIHGHTDGVGGAALFGDLRGLAVDGNYLYAAAEKIRRVNIATREVTTVCGVVGSGSQDGMCATAVFAGPTGVFKVGGYLYVSDAHAAIRRIDLANAQVTTFAGAQACGYLNGAGAAARFCFPAGMAGGSGSLYVADSGNGAIRQINVSSQIVSTLAGRGSSFSDINGAGKEARFAYPNGMTTDGANLYVAATGSSTIRAISISSGEVTTIAGAGHAGSIDGIGLSARFNMPQGITTDGTHLFVADTMDHTIRRINIATKQVTTLAGQSEFAGSDDGVGSSASLNHPSGITIDATNLYVTDRDNHTIRQINVATGAVLTIAGQAGVPGSTDAIGSNALLNFPRGITTDGISLFVCDSANHTIRKIVISTGTVSTLAGLSGVSGHSDGQGDVARFNTPVGITTDGVYLYVADYGGHTLRRIHIATGLVSTLAGSTGNQGFDDGGPSIARFSGPSGTTTDGKALYVTDSTTGIVRKLQ